MFCIAYVLLFSLFSVVGLPFSVVVLLLFLAYRSLNSLFSVVVLLLFLIISFSLHINTLNFILSSHSK